MHFPKSPLAILLITPIFCGETPRIAQDLTVHEWGTFTSVAGDDGSPVDWNTLGSCSDLPKFVNDFGFRNFKATIQGTVRMETPVMYFYTPRELDVNVKVVFPKGVMTEWYPQADNQIMQGAPLRPLPRNLNGIDLSLRSATGAIEWKNVKVQPDTSPILPTESGPNRYYAARETDAAPITVGDQHEKFLFYRGVGRFPVPLSARVSPDGKVLVENRTHDPVASVILFENHAGRLGYRKAGAVQDTVTIDSPSLDGSLAQLEADLESALIEQGLFPKEAKAMVATWQDSWFEEGSRLIYILSTRAVDAYLPLQMDPAPSAIARIFVGRVELITPDAERTVTAAIAQSDWTTLDLYARFLDPILSRIVAGNPSQADFIYRTLQARHVSAGTCR